MKQAWKKLIIILTIGLAIFSIGTSVIADDGNEHEEGDDGKKNEYYQESGDDDDKDEGGWENPQTNPIDVTPQNEYWNIWSREPLNNPNNPLPVSAPAELKVIVNNQETNIYFIPQDGQLLVSGDAIASALGAEAKYYSLSKICVLTSADHELIVRAGSNTAYENKVKTPIPTPAKSYEKSVYLPISVAANALGYRVTWDENTKALIIQSI